MRLIPLTQSLFTKVDDSDFEWLSQWKWFAQKTANGYYASRDERDKHGNGHMILMHRAILGLPHGDPRQGDHRDRDTLNNQRSNLRLATRSQNQWNQSVQSRPKSSKYKGVHWARSHRRWKASIYVHRKQIQIGEFRSEIEAAKAYNQAALKHHGDFAVLNEISK